MILAQSVFSLIYHSFLYGLAVGGCCQKKKGYIVHSAFWPSWLHLGLISEETRD